ncbi:hypothetical protein MK489_07775 [Myxococcota bacterium]|nr:hypothetical protein [Myxococcota bacterium]
MKPFVGILVFGALLATVQGVLGNHLPQAFCPDLGMLLVLALGLIWRSAAAGLLLAVLLGYLSDFLSGSLMGQLALLRILVFGAARAVSRQLSLLGSLPLALFSIVITAVHGVALLLLTGLFSLEVPFETPEWMALFPQMVLNAIFVTPMVAAVRFIAAKLGDDESGRRALPITAKGFRP